MNDRTPTERVDMHRRLVIRTWSVLALGISLFLAANTWPAGVESATYAASVKCPGLLSSDPDPQIWEIGFLGDEAIPERELDQACADARRPYDIGAVLFLLIALGLLPWALFADRYGHIRRRTDDSHDPDAEPARREISNRQR